MGLFSKATTEERLEKANQYVRDSKEKKAAKLFEELAQEGVQEAQMMLAKSYCTGVGVEGKDYGKAISWMQKAAEESVHGPSNLTAQCLNYLGEYYLDEKMAVPDVKKAIACYERSSAIGSLESNYYGCKSQVELGRLYLEGNLVEKDVEKARVLLEEVEKIGNTKACKLLGLLYKNEYGETEKGNQFLNKARRR